ncbi:mitochondrial chaperone BCS1 [Fusarium albosuccineum]|uniref:Mitochondrial chaperone BCS1 n=1 Tax=Fusarium albosuccineum TaxID=1237068 RepID=A0A8H4PB39_9HYPO|nr:mitochondrial chaperone BCS1 [Fusarium albosuccineum]
MGEMGLPTFLQGMNSTSSSNSSPSSSFPAGIMDTFLVSAGQASPLLQLYLFLNRLVGDQLGLEPSLVLTFLGCLWGLSKLFDQVYAMVDNFVSRYLRCVINVYENDVIYLSLMHFLSEHKEIVDNRHLTAKTVFKSAWDEEEDSAGTLTTISVEDGEDSPEYLNFASQAARSAPRYVPAMGTTGFWHNRTYFEINRSRESLRDTSGWGGTRDIEELRISCFGRSTDPIKALLADAKASFFSDPRQKTTVYRPRNKESRRDQYTMWQQVARRPIRPMCTVVLEREEKREALKDVNEYLHPATSRWYASRGIPLRRGYLFHGPPGTGKTSFSFALAGVFGIDIYVISLQDPSISEEDLAALFVSLPRRCIVLLEDIDTAGLRRPADGEPGKDDTATDSDYSTSDGEDYKKGRGRKKGGDSDPSRTTNDILTTEGISLSGLLNAIDGVASHEGRVLIMTTNKPESLDDALIRPGRVDVQVGFKNATSIQATELFYRMYENTQTKTHASSKPAAANGSINNTADARKNVEQSFSNEDLWGISEKFGSLIPEDTFSPAEIQGFLLKRKKSPREAVDDAAGWIEAAMKQKKLKSKVVTVQ